VLGYCALTPGAVDRQDLPERLAGGIRAHPIGVILLARLAVGRSLQDRDTAGRWWPMLRCGPCRELNSSALVRCSSTRETTVRRASYERLGFTQSPTDPLHLMVLITDLRRTRSSVRALALAMPPLGARRGCSVPAYFQMVLIAVADAAAPR
jgi:hypothetical protein